jgi:hypothetical protein
MLENNESVYGEGFFRIVLTIAGRSTKQPGNIFPGCFVKRELF